MSRISPKLIDVENNRVGTDDIIPNNILPNIKGDGSKLMRSVTGLDVEYSEVISYKQNITGRFPTQLFTNIKNDRYKYVKNIT